MQTSATMTLSSNSVRFSVVDGAVDQVGAVVDGVNGHALGQARRDLRERSFTFWMTDSAFSPKR